MNSVVPGETGVGGIRGVAVAELGGCSAREPKILELSLLVARDALLVARDTWLRVGALEDTLLRLGALEERLERAEEALERAEEALERASELWLVEDCVLLMVWDAADRVLLIVCVSPLNYWT